MVTPVPRQPFGRSSGYDQEVDIQTDINSLLRFFATKKLRYSLTTPPLLKDVPEGEAILDATAHRIYVTVGGVLYYIALTAA